MFYDPAKDNKGFKVSPFKACVVPRPIAWISSVNSSGITNLAPYSYFNAVTDDPPIVMFGSTTKRSEGKAKDSLSNIETTKEFVINLVTYDLREMMNKTSAPFPPGFSEIDYNKIETIPSNFVKPPRVKNSPINFECKYLKTVQLPTSTPTTSNKVIFGEVIGIHIDGSIITDGLVDITKFKPIARLGYSEYAVIEKIFSMDRANLPDDL